ncbi:MAG: O-antigen ligase family protein [Candidatus Aminicenantales bacterium]
MILTYDDEMVKNKNIRPIFLLLAAIHAMSLYFFYVRYVPLVKPFQIALVPIIFIVLILTTINVRWGTLFFIFSFPLINNLPYFFGLYEPLPLAPTALVLFLFYFLGWLFHNTVHKSELSLKYPILKPIILFSIIIFSSAIITFFRYANFYPFLSDYVYELMTNAFGVTAGGAIMSIVFNSLNYLAGLAFFFMLLNTVKSKEFVKKIIIVLCSSTFLSLIFGLFQHFKDMKLGNNPISIIQALINATFKDALSFGAYIAIVVPVILGGCFVFKGILRIFSYLVVILSLYMIFFTGSKSGLLGLFISLLIFLILSLINIFNLLKSKSLSWKKINLSSLVIVFLIVSLIFSFTIFKESITETITKSITFSRFKGIIQRRNLDAMFRGRADALWKMAVSMIRDYPLTGVGMGGYIIESSNYSEIYKTPIGTPESAENYILQVGSELGLIGIFFVLWIFWEIVKRMRRSYSIISTNDSNKFVLIGAIAGVISFLVIIQTHTFIGSYEIKYTFWLLVGLIFCMGRIAEAKDKNHCDNGLAQKPRWSIGLKISSIVFIVLFSGVHLWNSTHSLSLKSRTERFGLKQNFGLDQLEKTNDGREFRWTRSYGGMTITIEKPVIQIPLLASHPDINRKPVKVKIYLVKDFFKQKKLLDEIVLHESVWKTYEYFIPGEVNQEVILLVKVSRTWNPLKTIGTPDPRNLGVAIGKIQFKDTI